MPISVLLSFRNAAGTVGAAVRSILEQSDRDFELLALNDGSTDDSVARVKAEAAGDPRVRMLGDAHPRGLATRLNELIDHAHGELIARMDADDVAHPLRLESQRRALEADPRLDLLGTAFVVLDGDEPIGIRRLPLDHAGIIAARWRGVPMAHPTFMGRRAWFERHRYDPAFDRSQDQELLLRTLHESRFANLPEPLLGYRLSRSRTNARRARMARLRAVRRHVGLGAAFALGARDALAILSPARHHAGVAPLDEATRGRWQTLARSGRWPDALLPS